MESKIYLFKDRKDYVVQITDDNIINIVGSVGSGKSTYARKYKNNKDYLIIGLDSLYSNKDPDTLNNDILELRTMLKEKYGTIDKNNFIYYDDIVNYIKAKDKKGIIEGYNLIKINDILKFRGHVIVKRTPRFKCFYRSVLRDFKNPVWRVGLNYFGLIKRFFHCFKRRFNLIFNQTHIENFIKKLEKYKKTSY